MRGVTTVIALLIAGCGNTPTKAGTELTTIDTSGEIKKRYTGALSHVKDEQRTVEGCVAEDAPPPAVFDVSFKIAKNDKGDEFFVQNPKVVVKDAKGWSIESAGGETFTMGADLGGSTDFYQQVSTRILCKQQSSPFSGHEIGQPMTISARGTVEVH